MKLQSLHDLLVFLYSQDANSFKTDVVSNYLADTQFDDEQFLPFIFFREDCYGRNLVAKNEHFELLLLTWLPGQHAPVHDHAGQRCWTQILSGTLTFKNYRRIDGDRIEPDGTTEVLETGHSGYIDDGIALHSIANVSKKPAVSVHLYAAPIERCMVYDEKTQRLCLRELDYFTQVGSDDWEADIAELT